MAAALQCEICGGKLMGKPGGVFECDSCGMEYSTDWAKAKIQEVKGTVKVEGTVQVEGTVKVEGGVNIESLLKRGQMALESKEWGRAQKYFDDAMNLNAYCIEACVGFLLSEQKCSDTKELVKKRTYVSYDHTKFDGVPSWIVVMPKKSIVDESCIVTEWHINVGERINVGDRLFSYETDKATLEYVASEEGILARKFCRVGDEVPCLTPVAWILSDVSEADTRKNDEISTVNAHIYDMVEQYTIERYFTASQICDFYPTIDTTPFDFEVSIIKNKIKSENEFWTNNSVVTHALSIDAKSSLYQAKEEIMANLQKQLEEKELFADRKKSEFEDSIRVSDQRVVEAYSLAMEKKHTEEENSRKQAEEKKRQEDDRKLKRVADLNAEKAVLNTELSNLKGLFSGKRRKEIEARLGAICKELDRLG